MPAGATIIGRVAVKVLPDTSDFRKDAERKLSAIEKTLRISIPTKLDMTGASREFLEELRKINQRNRNNDARKIRFHTTISNDGMRDAIVKARRRLEQLADQEKITFKVKDLDVTGSGRLELDQKSLDDARDQLEKWRNKVSPLKVWVVPEVSTGASTIASARLALLSRPRTVPLIPVVDSKGLAAAATAIAALSGGRALADTFDKITDSLKNLDKNIPIIGSLALAVAGLTGFGITAVSNLAALVVSLSQIGPAVLALPGILGGMALGVGVMVAALKDFNAIFPDVKQKFSEMQDLISVNFWEKAKQPIREMLDTILPQLSEGFGNTATALGGYFAGIADGIKDTLSKALTGMFDDLAESIQIATGGTGALVGIITTLGEVGAGYLPRLAQWFVDITTQFNNFLSAAASDGRLQGWIDLALVNLQALGSVIGSIAGIIYSIGTAAQVAGGSGLTVLADTLNRIQATVESPAFQTLLVSVFEAAHRAMTTIAEKSGPAIESLFTALGNTLTAVLPLAGAAIGNLVEAVATAVANPAFQNGLVGIFASLLDVVNSITPVIPILGEALSAMMPIVGELAEKIGPILAAAFGALSQVVIDLSPIILTLIDYLGTQLLDAVNELSPIITGLSGFLAEHEGIAKSLAGVITGTVVLAYVSMATTATATAITKGLAWLSMTSAASAGAAGHSRSVAQIVAGWVLMAAKAVLHGAVVAVVWTTKIIASAVAATVKVTIEIAKQIAQWALMAAKALVHGLAVAAVWTAQIVASAVAATAKVVAQIAIQVARWAFMGTQALIHGARVAAAWLLALGPIGIITAAVIGAVVLIVANWETIKGAFQKGVAAVVGFVQDLPGKIKGFFSNAGSLLADAGRKIIDGLINGIKGAFGKVRDTLSSLTSMLPDWKGPAPKDRVLLVDAGKLVIDGFINGMEARYSAVRKSLTGLTKDVGSTVIPAPQVGAMSGFGSSSMSAQIAADRSEGQTVQKVLNYYAASGSSLGSEEDLFSAASRSRMVGW